MNELLTFGQYIKVKREAMRLSRLEAEKRMGIGVNCLMNYEKRGQMPKSKNLIKLIDFYKLTQEEITYYKLEVVRPEDNIYDIPKKYSKLTIGSLLADMSKIKNVLDKIMTGDSIFEQKMKEATFKRLEEAAKILLPVICIDQALNDCLKQ